MLAIALSLIPIPFQPHSLDRMTVERARSLQGRVILATFILAKPSYTLRGQTVIGAADQEDGVERGAVLRGNRLDLEEGKRVMVAGRLKVIDHAGGFVGGKFVVEWTEIRVEGR